MKKYRALMREKEYLERRIEKEREYADVIADTVMGSMTEPPYCLHTVSIEGVDESRTERRLRALRRKAERIEAEMRMIEDGVSSITDETVRRLVWLHMVREYTWEQAALEVYGLRYGNRDMARMAVKRYFDDTSGGDRR